MLIVDDSAVMRRIVRRALALCEVPLGTIQEASSGEQALEVLAGANVDLILTDIHMAHMTGLRMLELMKASEKFTNVRSIVVSSARSDELIRQARLVGAKGYLVKPFAPHELRGMVEKVLRE